MDRPRATIIVEPPMPGFGGLVQSGRVTHAYDELALELGRYLGEEVGVVESHLREAITRCDGMLLLDSPSFGQAVADCADSRVAHRIILLQADRTDVLATLEQYRFAGAVESFRYFRWRHHREQETGRQVYGLKVVASRMGAECASIPFASESYCLLDEPSQPDLPGLLAAYVRAYQQYAADKAAVDDKAV